jgi:rSAM/selenodomain-associated transferase 1
MHDAFERGLARHARVLLVGSDCPGLRAAHLREALRALESHDAVFIPAEDGGYVLVGLKRAAAAIFEGVAWGTPEVMAQTRARLAAAGLSSRELAALWDVDRPEDLERLEAAGLA